MTYEPFHLGSKKHVFIDWSLIEPGYGLSFGGSKPESWEMPYGIKLSAHLPQLPSEPMVRADRPWESGNARSGIGIYNTLFEDEGTFKLYYDAGDMSGELDVDEDLGTQRVLAYAESTDGVNWIKPARRGFSTLCIPTRTFTAYSRCTKAALRRWRAATPRRAWSPGSWSSTWAPEWPRASVSSSTYRRAACPS